jgi:GNAT superfamily N-acetyltransferase
MTEDDLQVRQAQAEDDAAVLGLLAATLGWSEDGVESDFFRWKHRDNPFGRSPAWVALIQDRIVGYRTFLRWEFLGNDDRVRRAVRAVDTVTDPDYRGRGIFRSLTLQGVADLTLDRTDWVFNTPNDSSRPGYLSMGWRDSGRVPVGFLPRSPRALRQMVTARAPANLWSEPCDVGLDAAGALASDALAAALLAHAPQHGVRTHRTSGYLSWRSSFAPLRYRLLLVDESDPSQGGLIFRLRRRGGAVEATVVEMLAPDARAARRLMRRVLHESGADYAIGTRWGSDTSLIPLPGQGPRLTTRPLASAPPDHRDWRLSLGDIELF